MKDKREALELPGSPMGRVCGEELWAARFLVLLSFAINFPCGF